MTKWSTVLLKIPYIKGMEYSLEYTVRRCLCPNIDIVGDPYGGPDKWIEKVPKEYLNPIELEILNSNNGKYEKDWWKKYIITGGEKEKREG